MWYTIVFHQLLLYLGSNLIHIIMLENIKISYKNMDICKLGISPCIKFKLRLRLMFHQVIWIFVILHAALDFHYCTHEKYSNGVFTNIYYEIERSRWIWQIAKTIAYQGGTPAKVYCLLLDAREKTLPRVVFV